MMNRTNIRRHTAVLALAIALAACALAGWAGEGTTLVWQIGQRDAGNAEFALAPRSYAKFKKDALFIIGSSDPKSAWPYVHPGPSDAWAGHRQHTFAILFGLESAPQSGICTLRLDLLDTQPKRGPKLRVRLNGNIKEQPLSPGAGDESVKGKLSTGKKQQYAVEFPATQLKAGANCLELTIIDGSWMLYDWLGLEAPSGLRLAPASEMTLIDEIRAPQALLRGGTQPFQPITVSVRRYAPPAEATIRIGDRVTTHTRLATGVNELQFPLQPVDRPTTETITISIDGKDLETKAIGLRPVRPWTVYVLPHSHVDIGYTEPQPEIELKQHANIDRALELARESAGNPEGERFKWNVEVLWAVDSYLKKSPENRAKFIAAVKDGVIGLDAFYCNILSGLCRPEELVRLVRFARVLGRECGVTIDSAMITDVPGLTWGITSVLGHAGVKYISDGVNLQHRVGPSRIEWQDKPFWWMSPSGQHRILFWTPYNGYWTLSIKKDMERALPDRLAELEAGGYPYDVFQVRWAIGDNGPPDEDLLGIVRAWNARFASPRLVIATTSQAFHALEERWGDKLPTYSGDFTPYWEDGAGSSARETALNRASAERLTQAEALYAMLAPGQYPAAEFWAAWRNVLLYSEHTWGASTAIRAPDSTMTQVQWKIKQAFALDAARISHLLQNAALGSGERAPAAGRKIDVFNTSSWQRSQLVGVPRAASQAGGLVRDDAGRPVPSQRLASGDLIFLAQDVPPFAARRYTIESGDPHAEGAAYARGAELGNGRLTVRLNEKTGAIAEIKMQGIDDNLVDARSEAGMNEYFYLLGGDLKDLQRAGAPKITIGERGPLAASLIIESDAPGCNRLTRELRIASNGDWLTIVNTVDKKPIREKEGVHFGFGFNVPGGQVRLETPWAVVRPDADQLPAACKNWFTVQRWVDISNERHGVTWAPVDAPLVEVGGLTANLPDQQSNPEAFRKHVGPTQTLYSWAMNNHWYTNYRADQEGPTTFRYVIRPHAGAFDPAAAARFGAEQSQPLIAAPALGERPLAIPRLTVEPAGVIVSAFKPGDDGKAWIVRLYGASGREERATVRFADPQPRSVTLSDIGEAPGAPVTGPVAVPAWGLVTLRAELPES